RPLLGQAGPTRPAARAAALSVLVHGGIAALFAAMSLGGTSGPPAMVVELAVVGAPGGGAEAGGGGPAESAQEAAPEPSPEPGQAEPADTEAPPEPRAVAATSPSDLPATP